MDGGAWQATVHGVAKSWTRLSDFTFTFLPTRLSPLLNSFNLVSRSIMCNSAVPWIIAHQAPLSMKFSWQEYWSGVPFPSPGNFPNPGIKPISLTSPALEGGFFATRASTEIGKPCLYVRRDLCILLLPSFSSSSLCLPQRCIIYILHLLSRMFNFINVVEFLDIKICLN